MYTTCFKCRAGILEPKYKIRFGMNCVEDCIPISKFEAPEEILTGERYFIISICSKDSCGHASIEKAAPEKTPSSQLGQEQLKLLLGAT